MGHHLIHAHWYYLLIGYGITFISNMMVEDNDGCASLLVALVLNLAGSVFIALGIMAILGWGVA